MALDDVIQQRVRLGVLAILAEINRCDFAYLRRNLEVTDGNLSSHLQQLESVGYVRIEKGYEGKRPRTWIELTPAGRRAFDQHIAALRRLVKRSERAR
jgi:DNA-binding MarR family transcriptional regulator